MVYKKLINDLDLIRSLEISIKIRIATIDNCYRITDRNATFKKGTNKT